MADGSFSALRVGSFDLGHSLEFFLEVSAGAGCVLLEGEDDITAFDRKHLVQQSLDPNNRVAASPTRSGTSNSAARLVGSKMDEGRAIKKQRITLCWV
ncbi:hypothetical protein D9619_013731 [Psilocybe cf. subviscida]|uniref:Uncharacterized protein n=1 Tax=Psilocybe cf. subviscida TaxID=2480587 RepID=A0A8H5BHW2_9AGAR|nr:hypothetical protein D9619_013731 [Psilocybe cf. subviscida]